MQKLRFIKFHAKHLIYAQLFFVCIVLFFITEFGVPSSLMNITDIITCVLLVFAVLSRIGAHSKKKLNYVDVAVCIFLIYALLTSAINGIDLLQVIWAFRVTFRFYIFYYCCVALLGCNDVRTLLRMFEILFVFNAVLVAFEYVVQGKQGDCLGGMFGIEQGANGYMNIYLILMLAYEVTRYLRRRQTLKVLVLYFLVVLVIAALAEMKFLYVEVIVIALSSVLFRFPNRKVIILLAVLVGALAIGLQMLRLVFPESYEMMLTGEGTDNYLDASWTAGREMGRTTAIAFVDTSFFSNYIVHETYGVGFGNLLLNRLFGLGFGSAEPSRLMHNPFAEQYSGTQYGAFEFADRYLEMGWIGLFLYSLIFIMIFVSTFKKEADSLDVEQLIWRETVRIIILIVLMNIWYGNLRTEASYMLFFFLSLPRIQSRNSNVICCEKGF